MLDVGAQARGSRPAPVGPPLDFQAHLGALDAAGLLVRVDRPIDKDTELHPLVRWQFQGGLAEDARRAFLFTNVVDASGRRYDIPVAAGALAASPQIYADCSSRKGRSARATATSRSKTSTCRCASPRSPTGTLRSSPPSSAR